jgi:NADPH:quinone reductase-like Zn-dependent oxidoreductase
MPTTHGKTTMQAVTRDAYGGPEAVRLEQVERPEPADNEVLLEVRAAGLDRGVWHVMAGLPYLGRLAFGLRRPKNPVLGLDVAGTVARVGSSVTRYAVGDEVYGFGSGTFAEYAVAREDKLARKPVNVSFEQASVVPVSAATALQALTEVGHVEAGQQVLVIGASGGVGSYAVQLAKAFGAEVTAVCSTAKLDLVRSLGADHAVDYTSDDFADGAHRYDLILDIAGNPGLSRLRRALTPSGTAVLVGGEEGGNFSGGMNRQLRAVALSPFIGQRMTMFIAKQRSRDLEQLTELIEAGKVSPSIDRTYALDEAPEAIRRLVAGLVRGKVALTI